MRRSDFAAERLHRRLAAEHGRGERDRHPCVEVARLALEDRVRRQPDAEKEIARRRAAGAGLAFAGDPDARSFSDAGGNPDIDRACVAVVLDGEPPRGAVVGVLEIQLDLLLDVAARARGPAAAAASSCGRPRRRSPHRRRTCGRNRRTDRRRRTSRAFPLRSSCDSRRRGPGRRSWRSSRRAVRRRAAAARRPARTSASWRRARRISSAWPGRRALRRPR